jgi:hypothetical protein
MNYRREELYASYLTCWRQQLQANDLQSRKRGRKPDPQAAEVARSRRENEQAVELYVLIIRPLCGQLLLAGRCGWAANCANR